jgi:hypothetical protein
MSYGLYKPRNTQWWQGQQTPQQQPAQPSQPAPTSNTGGIQYGNLGPQPQQQRAPQYSSYGNQNAPGYGGAAANALNSMQGGGSFNQNLRNNFIQRENYGAARRGEAFAKQAAGAGSMGDYSTFGDPRGSYSYWGGQEALKDRGAFQGIQIQGPQQQPVVPENAPDWFQAPVAPTQPQFSFGQQEYDALQQMSDKYKQALEGQSQQEYRMAHGMRTPQQTRGIQENIFRQQNYADIARRQFADMMGQYLGQDFGGANPMELLGAYGGVENFDPYLQNLISQAQGGGQYQEMQAPTAPQYNAPPPRPAAPPSTSSPTGYGSLPDWVTAR